MGFFVWSSYENMFWAVDIPWQSNMTMASPVHEEIRMNDFLFARLVTGWQESVNTVLCIFLSIEPSHGPT